MSRPDIIILDQPTKDLDPDNKIIFWKNLKTVLKGSTIIYSSYDFDEIQDYSDRIAFLSNGNTAILTGAICLGILRTTLEEPSSRFSLV